MLNLLNFAGSVSTAPEIIVDLFAGGGGASEGIKMALGRDPEAAINHNPLAVAMHSLNHPGATHYTEDVWNIAPTWVTKGRPVGLLWASPDCTHFSKAKGGKPNRDDRIRSLALVITDKWIPEVRPRVIIMENVEEMQTWGPLDKDGVPIPEHAGDTWRMFIRRIKRAGYSVGWKEFRACDYGAPTIRKRLFLIARCDGQSIVWPDQTHGDPQCEAVRHGVLNPWRTAAECIDFSIPCPSVFDSSKDIFKRYGIRAKRPLAENTLKRIAKGVQRFVIDTAEPFIMTYYGPKNDDFRGQSLFSPLATQTSANRHAFIAPSVMKMRTGAVGHSINDPMHTITAGGKAKRASTGNTMALITSNLLKMRGQNIGSKTDSPLHTISAGGCHHAEVRTFLLKYYGQGFGQSAKEPIHTITSKDRFGLVTVRGEDYYIADIGMRMLTPRELYRAQGFRDDYIIDRKPDGSTMTKADQVKMVGNSVCPPMAAALVRANCAELAVNFKEAVNE